MSSFTSFFFTFVRNFKISIPNHLCQKLFQSWISVDQYQISSSSNPLLVHSQLHDSHFFSFPVTPLRQISFMHSQHLHSNVLHSELLHVHQPHLTTVLVPLRHSQLDPSKLITLTTLLTILTRISFSHNLHSSQLFNSVSLTPQQILLLLYFLVRFAYQQTDHQVLWEKPHVLQFRDSSMWF